MKLILTVSLLALAAPALAQTPAAAPQNTPGSGGHTVRGPSLALSIEAAQAAIDSCKATGYLVGATVVDDEGGIRISMTADGAPTEGPNGSRRKAVTSAQEKTDGAALAERVKTDPALAARLAANNDSLARAGALLIKVGDRIVGVIGVEGNPHDLAKNVSCAQAGIDGIKARLN